jgi:hypothetical protein
MLDQRQTWWIWNVTTQRLSKWALALLHGRRYTIRLTSEGTGYHDPLGRIIQVNPQLFPEESVAVQFRLTQGLLAHECGHAWFTGNWPEQSDNVLQELSNLLEDQRVENAICALYPGVAPAVRLLGDHVYASLQPASHQVNLQVYACCLAWRWAHSRTSQAELFGRLGVSPAGQDLWIKIRPLVEQAWCAADTSVVIRLAKEILSILELPESAPRLGLTPLNPQGIPHSGANPISLPSSPADTALGLGGGVGEAELPTLPGIAHSLDPAAYLELEQRVRPQAACLAEALTEPRPDRRLAPHEYRGRYSFRQEIRTPDRPHLAPQEIDRAARSLVLYVLVDRSGSMERFEQAVREALMTIYLAAMQVAIPLGIAYFGEDDFFIGDLPMPVDQITLEQTVSEIAPLSAGSYEPVKALIAGYSGWSCEEYLDWGLRKAENELRTRPERLKVLLITHDGDPVFHTRSVSDWDLSLEHLRALERAGVIPIGIHLGDGNLEKLHKLFTRLVNCPDGHALPAKLGEMLCSLG